MYVCIAVVCKFAKEFVENVHTDKYILIHIHHYMDGMEGAQRAQNVEKH